MTTLLREDVTALPSLPQRSFCFVFAAAFFRKITSKCIYDGILHFELKLEDVYAPNWMIENPEFYAYSLDDLGKAFELIYKFEPNIFKNKKDIDIWNADLN